MNQKITGLLQSPRRLLGSALVGVGVVLLVASVAGALSSPPPTAANSPTAVAGTSKTSPDNATPEPAPVQTTTQDEAPKKAPAKKQTSTPQTQGVTNQPSTSTEKPAAPEPAIISVTLKVNDNLKGVVTLPRGSDQCDVLQHALDDGVISSLHMKYHDPLKTYGVYVIDDIGDNENLGWTYKVNDGFVLGCSLVTAKNGDVVSWKYVN